MCYEKEKIMDKISNEFSLSKKIKIAIGKFLYVFCSRLPCSYSRINIRQKRLRQLCGKMILKKCGKNVNIEKGALFSADIELGDNSGIGRDAELECGITIGDNVMMGPCVKMYVQNHNFSRTDIPMNQQGDSLVRPIVICDDVWIGANVIILPGVSVGKGCVIGAGSVVTKSIPEYSVVAGNPAKIIKNRMNNV